MKAVSGKDLAKVVESHGWKLLRIHGSHHIYGRPNSVVRLSIPIHSNRPLKIGLLKHLMRMAGLSEADLAQAMAQAARVSGRPQPRVPLIPHLQSEIGEETPAAHRSAARASLPTRVLWLLLLD